MSEVKDMLRGSLTVYDKEGDGFEATVFAQLDHIAATFDRYWANESDPSAGAEHAKRLDALSEELGVHWAYLAAGNVQWLEQRGHLKVDDFNGMLFYFSLPNPVRPGERILVVRSSLDPTPEQQQMLIRER